MNSKGDSKSSIRNKLNIDSVNTIILKECHNIYVQKDIGYYKSQFLKKCLSFKNKFFKCLKSILHHIKKIYIPYSCIYYTI